MNPEQPALELELGPAAPGGRTVRTRSGRALQVARLLEGRSADEALRMLPRLFGVCSQAHQAASADAMREALAGQADTPVRARRQRLVRVESLREQLLQIQCEWPAALGQPARRDSAVEMLRLAQAAQTDDSALQELARWTHREVLDMPAVCWLELGGLGELQAWARKGTTAAAQFLHHLFDTPAGHPVEGLPALEDLDPCSLQPSLAGDDTFEFTRRPEVDGRCLETGPAARQRHHALARASAGHGLLGRFVARLIDVASCIETLRNAEDSDPGPAGDGLGWADCARGRLLHHVEFDAARRIRRYRIVAPTEWNTHPRGLCARLLGAIGPGSLPMLRRQTRLVMLAVDPCVPARVLLPAFERSPGDEGIEAGETMEPHHA